MSQTWEQASAYIVRICGRISVRASPVCNLSRSHIHYGDHVLALLEIPFPKKSSSCTHSRLQCARLASIEKTGKAGRSVSFGLGYVK